MVKSSGAAITDITVLNLIHEECCALCLIESCVFLPWGQGHREDSGPSTAAGGC